MHAGSDALLSPVHSSETNVARAWLRDHGADTDFVPPSVSAMRPATGRGSAAVRVHVDKFHNIEKRYKGCSRQHGLASESTPLPNTVNLLEYT